MAKPTMFKSVPLAIQVDPQISEAEITIREAVSRHRVLLVIGRCWVRYAGRAASKLEPGERILIVKRDGSLLVHRSTGYEPVNWQSPGCIFHTRSRNGILEVRAIRQKPMESIKVFFDQVYLVLTFELTDTGVFSLHASEEDMHRAVLMRPSLLEVGFKPISYEKKVEPGFVDVYGIDKEGRLVIVEIKRKTASKEAALQLAKYIKATKGKSVREVRGILAAPSIAKSAHRVLDTLGLQFKYLDPKKCAETLRKAETRKLAEWFANES